MKVLLGLNSAQFGGMEYHVRDLVAACSNADVEVHVWCPNGPLVTEFESLGAVITLKRVQLDLDPFYIWSLKAYLQKNKIDVVHAHELKSVTNVILAAFLAKTPVKISHTHTPLSEWQIGSLKKWLTILGYSNLINLFVTKEIALTPSRKAVKISEGIREDKLVVIPNCVTSSFKSELVDAAWDKQEYRKKYGLNPDMLIFGNVSRFTQEKDHETILRGYAEFLESNSSAFRQNTALVLFSDGPLKTPLIHLAKSLNISENVFFLGYFEEKDKVHIFNMFDIFIFSSKAEGFGLVLIEAMSMGIPTISSNLEVLQEVGGSDIFYFNMGDPSNLAFKLKDLVSKKDKLGNVGLNAKQRVKELYSFSRFSDSYINLYNSLLKR